MTRSDNSHQEDEHSLHSLQFESPSHTGTLLTGLNKLRDNGLLLDVTLVAGGEPFKVITSPTQNLNCVN